MIAPNRIGILSFRENYMNRKLLTGLAFSLSLTFAVGLTACTDDDILKYTLSDDGSYYICAAARAADPTITQIEIPATYNGKPVAEIGHMGFLGMESVTIPDSVKVIGTDAFSGCPALKNVTIGKGVEKIEKKAFLGCTALESIAIPDNVTQMGSNVFEQCVNLKEVSFGAGITSIPDYTFYYCENIGHIVLPDTVETVEDWAFALCGIQEITFGSGVTTIGENAFSECTNLKSVTLPEGLTALKRWAFNGCTRLETVFYNGRNALAFDHYTLNECMGLKGVFTENTFGYWVNHDMLKFVELVDIYFYSETEPTDDDLKYWHYVDGEIAVWE